MHKICLLVAVLIWLAMLWVTDHYLPWVSWHSEVMACLALFFLWLSWVFQKNKTLRVIVPNAVLFFVAIGGWVIIQVLCGQLLFPSDALVLWLNLALIILAICLGFHYVNIRPRSFDEGIEVFFTVLLATAFILAVQAMIRAFDLELMSEWIAGVGAKRRPGSNLSQPNHLATFLNWGIISLVYLHFRSKVNRFYFYLALLPLVFGIVLSESRTGLLSFSCVCVILGCMRTRVGQPRLFGLLGVWVTTSLLFVWWPDFWAYIQMVDGTGLGISMSSSGRVELWFQSLTAIAVHPFGGWGYRQFAWAHISTLADLDSALVATYSHNLVLDFLIWFGLPVGGLLITSMARWLCTQIAHSQSLVQKILLLFLLPFGLHAMLEFPHAYLYFLIPVGFCIGALSVFSRDQPQIQLTRHVFHGAFVFVFVFALWSAYEYFVLEEDFRLARFASARVGSDPVGYQRSNTYLLRQVADLVDVVRKTPSDSMTEIDIEQARRVALYYPWLGTLTKYALVLKLNGHDAEYVRYAHIVRVYFGEGAVLRLNEKVEILRTKPIVR